MKKSIYERIIFANAFSIEIACVRFLFHKNPPYTTSNKVTELIIEYAAQIYNSFFADCKAWEYVYKKSTVYVTNVSTEST